MRGFHRYNERYLRRGFCAVRAAGLDRLPTGPDPVVVYLNHPGWWDPLTCALLVRRAGAARRHWALIDAAELERYGILKRLGFVGIERDSRAGARHFRRIADALGGMSDATLWFTPQGRFADPRERPVRLAPGLAHLARRVPRARFVPLAIEYPFREERLPEARLRVGEPWCPADASAEGAASEDVDALGARFAASLEATCDALARDVVEHRDDAFETLLDGRRGVAPLYDAWRALGARLRGERFEAGHARGHDERDGADPARAGYRR